MQLVPSVLLARIVKVPASETKTSTTAFGSIIPMPFGASWKTAPSWATISSRGPQLEMDSSTT
jgi:hypothetical protein